MLGESYAANVQVAELFIDPETGTVDVRAYAIHCRTGNPKKRLPHLVEPFSKACAVTCHPIELPHELLPGLVNYRYRIGDLKGIILKTKCD